MFKVCLCQKHKYKKISIFIRSSKIAIEQAPIDLNSCLHVEVPAIHFERSPDCRKVFQPVSNTQKTLITLEEWHAFMIC